MLNQVVKVRLLPTEEQTGKLRAFQLAYVAACDRTSQWVFDHGFGLAQRKLHAALYYPLREEFGLLAQVTQSVIRTVIARHKTVQTQMRQKPYRYRDKHTGQWHREQRDLPWLQKPLRFRSPVAVLLRGRDYSLKKGNVYSVATLGGREDIPFLQPENAYYAKFLDGSWRLGSAELLERRGKWYLHISAEKEPDQEFQREDVRHVVGIDRGLRQLVTVHDEADQTIFFSGQEVLRRRRKYKQLRRELQQRNTKASRRRLREIERRENRWMQDVNHCITKALVEQYDSGTLFVLEDLTDVRFATERVQKDRRYEQVSWSFFDLEQKLAYKAAERGSLVLKVDAHYTSQRCPKCGAIDKENRIGALHAYQCGNCGYRSNDDRVAAMNIQELGKQHISGVKQPKFEKVEPTH